MRVVVVQVEMPAERYRYAGYYDDVAKSFASGGLNNPNIEVNHFFTDAIIYEHVT